MTPKNLESVIYFAQYLVLEIDEDQRKKALTLLENELKNKKEELEMSVLEEKTEINEMLKEAKSQVKEQIKDNEQRDMTISEVELNSRQKLITTRTSVNGQQQQLTEIYQKLTDIVKSKKILDTITEDEFFKLKDYGVSDFMKVGMGAEAVLSVIKHLDIEELVVTLREDIKHSTGQKFVRMAKRLRLVEGLKRGKIKPEWMVLTILPVIPPDLRPMVQLTGGRFATSDLNDLYRRVINRNNRLKHLINLGAPEIILRNEKRMLQEAVDALIDSTQRVTTGRTAAANQTLKSLSDMLRGKQGRFRQNLLGKRVDYSGRSVIVVGPELSLNQCGLPKEMALEMFKPFVLREIIIKGLAPNVKSAKHLLERRTSEVWDILDEITRDHPVLLNRAPTLHKLGFQAFKPVLIEGNAIRIHPCVCAGYNADFDGDQMAVHIPLSGNSCEEALRLMTPQHNLLKPADGSPITVPNKDMALGSYYLTSIDDKLTKDEKEILIFGDEQETISAYQNKKIMLRQLVKVRINGEIINTTVGRILFNEALPEQLRFMNEEIKAATIKNLITKALNVCPDEEIVKLIDDIKKLGFWAATISGGLSVSVFDNLMIPNKNKLIEETEEKITEIENNLQEGLITKEEQRRLNHELWIETTEKIADMTWDNLPTDNPVRMIIHSGGARASKDQLKQLAAMRGLVVDPLGKIVEMPTKSNFMEGLTIF